jgi:TetR/AcrR family transcriptional regulator
MRCGREAILKAAMQVFARKGYSAASTREICAAAGITKPVLYYHFRDKEHLYQELLIDCYGQHQKRLLRASKGRGNLRARLVRILDEEFRQTREDPVRVEMILRMIFAPPEQRPFFSYIEESEKQRDLIAGVFQDAIETGEAWGDARRLATALMGINLIAVLEHHFTGRSTLTRRSAERYVDLLLDGCRRSEEPTGR